MLTCLTTGRSSEQNAIALKPMTTKILNPSEVITIDVRPTDTEIPEFGRDSDSTDDTAFAGMVSTLNVYEPNNPDIAQVQVKTKCEITSSLADSVVSKGT